MILRLNNVIDEFFLKALIFLFISSFVMDPNFAYTFVCNLKRNQLVIKNEPTKLDSLIQQLQTDRNSHKIMSLEDSDSEEEKEQIIPVKEPEIIL